jgi:predicted permease
VTARPPRLARAIVSAAAEPVDRPWLLADLDQEFAALAATDTRAAHRWYWHQAITSVLPLVRRRARRRPPTVSPARPEMFTGFRTDLRHTIRSALRTPAPTAAILLTMALGIGATAAVSTVVWKVLLQPLPMREPDRVLAVYRAIVGTSNIIPSVSYPDLQDWRRRSTSLVGIAPYTGNEATLIRDTGPVPVNATQVGEDFFKVLGSRFALGRAFEQSDFDEGAGDVAVLSGAMWKREFASDPNIVGKSIELASGRVTVVGVVGLDEFTLPLGGADLWVPLHVPTGGPTAWKNSRGTQWLEAVARVRFDRDVGAAMAELRTIDEAVQKEFPRPTNAKTVLGVEPLQQHIAGPVRTMLLFLAGAIVIVLLVVCTNVANLRLVQAQAREGELAMRVVLGASAGRLWRQVLTESMVLALTGGVVGILIARPLLSGLLALYPGHLPRVDEVRLDPGTIAWSLGLAAITGVLFAVPQLLNLLRMDAGRLVKDGERGTSTKPQRVARRAMVVVQLALSVVMLVASGLLVRTFLKVTRVSAGFASSGVLSFELAASESRYQGYAAAEQLFQDLGDRLRAIPGVRTVAATNALPLTFNPWRNGVRRPNTEPGADDIPVNMRVVSPEYMEMLGVPLKRGRMLNSGDIESAPLVVMINEGLASLIFPGEDPIGRFLPGGSNPRMIVGVVGNLHHTSLVAPVDNEVYAPFRQSGLRRSRVIAMKVDGDPSRYVDAAERAVRAVDPQLPIRNMRSLADIVSRSVAPQRFRAVFIGSLAVLALALAVVGIYGVMSYAVTERTRELGIRMALGEAPSRVRGRIVLEALQLAALGTALGGFGAWLATRTLASLMFEVGAGDPWTLASVAVVLTAVTLIAADGPARRAARVDPISAIRAK